MLKTALVGTALWLAASGMALAAQALPAAATTAAASSQEALVAELDGVVRSSVTLAHTAQYLERTIGALERALAESSREMAAKQRALDDSRAKQGEILGALQRLARNPPEAALLAPQQPIDRLRSGMLMAAAVPSMAAEARALTAEIERQASIHAQIVAKQNELAQDRQALAKSRLLLAQMFARRTELRRQILRDDADGGVRAVKLGTEAVDVPDLIKRADAEAKRRETELRIRAPGTAKAKVATPAVDPTRPKNLRGFDPRIPLLPPVAGTVSRRFGEADTFGAPSQGLSFASLGAAEVVAPFDGRVDYVGPFRGYGVILIIGHGGGYHSLLAGLGRVDARVGEWVVAGEPIGAMPETAKSDASVAIYFELRRDGRPIDPQLSLAGREEKVGDHKVRE